MLEFRVLGPLQVANHGRLLPLGGSKQRAVLALLLLLRNRVVARDLLVDALWGEDPPQSAANSIQIYVSTLRRLLADGDASSTASIITEAPGYRLRVPPGEVDADRFTRLLAEAEGKLASGSFEEAEATLARALAIWRGPALADFSAQVFAQPEIARLEALRFEALNAHFDAMMRLGRQAEAVGELQALVGMHPLDERLRAQLMVALYRSGRQAEALDVYRSSRRLLSEELGLEPGPELRAVEQAILRQDASLGASAPIRDSAIFTGKAALARAGPTSLEGERPLSVLVADIVGSAGLADRLERDEVNVLVRECVTMMTRAVEEYGGTVQAYQGDGICAYFGVPTRHEDDPERAAHAALRILEVIRGYADDIERAWGIPDFAVRVGINSGQATVALVGGADPQLLALGETPGVAHHLQAAARPGTIAVGKETARRLARGFVLEPFDDPASEDGKFAGTASVLVGARQLEPAAAATPMVGRMAELQQLHAVVDGLSAGRGHTVLLVGEAGMGKTRLLAEIESVVAPRVTWLRGECHSYGGPPGSPLTEILLGWLGAEIGEPEIATRTKARAGLGGLFGDELDEILVPLASLLRIRLELSATPSGDDIERAYLRWLEALSASQPVIVVLEDAHWADEQTRKLAEAVLELTERAPVALVVTEEPIPDSEGAALRLHAVARYPHSTTLLSLGPLPEAAADELLSWAVEPELESQTRLRLLREAEGNPLYLEELARTFLEGALEPRGRTWTVSVGSLELLPPTLENLLVARIDRQPDGPRRLAQIAAVVGRRFPVDVVESVSGEHAQEPLTALERAGIVREVTRYPHLECAFTHGLLRDAVLATLTPPRKRSIYAGVASAFEALRGDALEEHFERLAHYHAQSGNLPQALEYAAKARSGTTKDG